MGDDRVIIPSPAPSPSLSETGTKTVEIIHYDVLLTKETIQTPATTPDSAPTTTLPLRPPSPYGNLLEASGEEVPTAYGSPVVSQPQVAPSPYRIHSTTPSRASSFEKRGSVSVTPPGVESRCGSALRQSIVYSSQGSPYDDGSPRMTPQMAMEAYVTAAAQHALRMSRGPLEAGSEALTTLQPEGPFISDDVVGEKRPMKLYKVVIGMIVILILFAMYWIFVYPNVNFGTFTRKRVEVAPNADM